MRLQFAHLSALLVLLAQVTAASAGELSFLERLVGEYFLKTVAGERILAEVAPGIAFRDARSRLATSAYRRPVRLWIENAEARIAELRIAKGRPAVLVAGELLDLEERNLLTSMSENFAEHSARPYLSYDENLMVLRGKFAGMQYRKLSMRAAPTPQVVEIEVRTASSILRGVNYPRPGGIPVVAIHGFAENTRVFRDLMRRLYAMGEEGYDIYMFNMVGHGNGTHLSKVLNGRNMGFHGMVETDLPAILEHVTRRTGQRVLLVGHSMGGMISRAATAAHVFARVEIGSPRDLTDLPLTVRLATRPVILTSKLLPRTPFPFPVTGRAPTTPDAKGLLGAAEEFFSSLDPLMLTSVPKGTVNRANLSTAELIVLRQKILSRTPSDLFGSFAREILNMESGRSLVPFNLVEDNGIPTLLITAEYDNLASPLSIYGAVRKDLEAGRLLWLAEMEGFGHVDMVHGERGARRVAPLIHDFVQNPYGIAPAGRLLILPQF